MFALYHGKDTYRSLSEVRIKINAIKEQSQDTEIVVIDADSSDPEKILTILSSTDLFAPSKVVLLKRVLKNRGKETLIEALMETLQQESIPDTLFWEDQKVNGITKYYKFFKKNDAIVEFDQMKKPGLVKWATEQLESLGMKGDRNSVYELATRVNFEAERLMNELEKLVVSGVKALDQNALQNTTDTFEFDIWKLIDAINENNHSEALNIAENLLGQEQDPNYILAMLARNTKLLVEVKHLRGQGLHTNEIASKLRVPPFTIPALISSTEKTSMERLKSIYEKLSALDYEIKRGGIDPNLGLTLLLTKL